MNLRRRQAPRAAAQSDVTRFRGVVLAAAAGAVATTALALASTDSSARRGSPGPLARPHQVANLVCESCHRDGERPRAAACTGCHGAHPSIRPAHAELAAAGSLGCADCHAGHTTAAGVTFLADGRAIRYGGGRESALPAGLYQPPATVTVPLVPAAACARCHDPASPRDPLAACLIGGQAALRGARPTVCFDEHRRAGDESAARTAAWEAAREVAALPPIAAPPRRRPAGPWLWLGVGALVSGAAFGGTRLRRRRRPPAAAPLVRPPEVVRLPTINASTCIGCRACVDACPYDVLELRRYVAVVARPADCCGLTLCEQKCPNGSLVMGDGVPVAGQVAVTDALESREAPGLYFAGDVTGMPLIRNAINQGAHAVTAIADSLSPRRDESRLDLVIVGAGPAGLSAALAARARGLRTLVLEQGSVADSIRSFPRGKLVFDQPLDLPVIGPLWLAESTKEELLGRWLRIVRQEQLPIREGVRVTSIDRDGAEDGFAVTTAEGKVHRARRVLIATGRRGSPRRLAIPIPPAWADHVHYSLADAESFAGRRVLVVGLGDVAMETAIALSRQPGTAVTVSYRGDEFHRGKARNIAEMRRRAAAAALQIRFQSEVSRLEPGRAVLTSPAGEVEIPCDSVFVMIGRAAQIAEPGRPFLALTREIRPEAT